MLAFFRRLINSKAGLVVTFLVLGMIALAFAAGDVSSLRTEGLAALGGGDEAAKVGKVEISSDALKKQVAQQLDNFRQQQPTLDMAQFVAGGGFEGTLDRFINGDALEQFGEKQGMRVSKRSVDGVIASIPGLQAPNGDFDPTMFRQMLAERKLTEAAVRSDIAQGAMGQMLTVGMVRPGIAPLNYALPYAGLSLEKRSGEIAFVPTAALMGGPAPTDAALQAFYGRNVARYTVPERRVVRYALVTAEQVKARSAPSEAEIARNYQQNAAKYAASEQRSITQVVVLDQAGATALAAKAKGGASLTDAARAAGLETTKLTDLDKTTLGQRSSPALADAVFGAGAGSVVGPVRGGLGYTVAKVDAIRPIAGRTLAQVHDTIAAELTRQKTTDALKALYEGLDDKLADNATFDELVADQKLSAQTSAPLLANGTNPDQPAAAADPALAPLVKAVFAMQDGDEPQLVATGADGGFGIVALGPITPAAPRPLAQIRSQVAQDFTVDRAGRAAQDIANRILAAVNKGRSLPAAWAAAGVKSAPPHALDASRDDVMKAQGPARAPLALMFAMTAGSTRVLAAPDGGGWAVIHLNRIIPGDARQDPVRVTQARQALGQVLGQEYLQQFVRSVRDSVGVKVNQPVVAKAKADLLSSGGGN